MKKRQRDDVKLCDISGTKIRWQYFTVPIYIIWSMCFLMVCSFLICSSLKKGSDLSDMLGEIASVLYMLAIITLPFAFLAILNRFLFGKIICVLDEKGMHCREGFIRWEDISEIAYDIDLPGKHRWGNSSATVTGKYINGQSFEILLNHAPHHLIYKAKRLRPDINAHFTKDSFVWIFLFTVFPVVLPILIVFLEPYF